MQGLPNYEKDVRPWGQFERFTLNEKSTVKIITVNPNEELSLQQHEHRDEDWHILSGSGSVVIGEQRLPVRKGEDFFVARGVKHRVAGGPHGLVFLEIALGEFDENDIKRLEDRYGRA
jgi:mannose-6-phosphate isomerase-like protein (cupin superfamily)